MKVLILGGTQFIGRHVTNAYLAAGHTVVHANRGKTRPEGILGVQQLKFDRSVESPKELDSLKQDWDVVVDLTAYFPKQVEFVASNLKDHIGRYVFCSTISVYKESLGSLHPQKKSIFMTEESELLACTPEQAIDTSMMTYGNKKAECERVLRKYMPNSTIIRPSVVYGEYDPTDRFAYWIARACGQKRFLLPEDGLTITHKTYGPDLGQAFLIAGTLPQAAGQTYNVADREPLSLRDSLSIMGSLENGIPVSAASLQEKGVRPWLDLPLWIPSTHFLVSTTKIQNDLGFRSTPSDVAAQNAREAFLKEARAPKAGLSLESESSLIASL